MRIGVSIGVLLLACTANSVEASDARVGLQFAFGSEQGHLFGSGRSSRTEIVMFQPQLAVGLSHAGGRPRFELVTEFTLGASLKPYRGRFILTLNEGVRFQVRPAHKLGGYLEMGAGIGSSALHTDPNSPNPREDPEFRQLNGWLQFHLQTGIGLRLSVGRGSVQLGYRLTHFSNNRTALPNLGLNLHTAVVSYQTRPF